MVIMEFDNKLQKDILEYMNNNQLFFNHGYSGTHFYNTWEVGKDPFAIEAKKPHGGKYSINASILIYSNRQNKNEHYGVEFKVEMFMYGYQTEEVVFQGWVESLEEFKIILKSVGLF